MSSSGIASALFALVLSVPITAADVVIPPLIEARAAYRISESLSDGFVVNRAEARTLGRVVFPTAVAETDSRVLRDGVERVLPEPFPLSDSQLSAPSPFGVLVSTRIDLEGASGARLRFARVPEGTVLWVAGSEDEEFARFVPSEERPWGPTTTGSKVFIASEMDLGTSEVVGVASIQRMEHQPAANAASTACLEDVACAIKSSGNAELPDAMRAVAYLRIVRNGETFVCTGSLVSDASASRTPYLLTARHCVPDQAAAASMEIIWDLRTAGCGLTRMEKYARSYGARLLVASAATDMALLRLDGAPPSGRVFLGVSTRRLQEGDVIYRVSHPYGLAQTYTASVVTASGSSCVQAPRPQFVYSEPLSGGIATGSSGAPMIVGGLLLTGQLLGLCGAAPGDPCARFNDAVDGSVRESWPLLAPYLAPGSGEGVTRRRASRH